MGGLLVSLIDLYTLVLLARVLMSWIPNLDPYNPIVQVLYQVTEPVLEPVRSIMQRLAPEMGMIDLSPIIVFILLRFLQTFLIGL